MVDLAEFVSLADDVRRGGSLRLPRHSGAIAQAGVPCSAWLASTCKTFARDPEASTYPGDIAVVDRLPNSLSRQAVTELAPPSSSRLHLEASA